MRRQFSPSPALRPPWLTTACRRQQPVPARVLRNSPGGHHPRPLTVNSSSLPRSRRSRQSDGTAGQMRPSRPRRRLANSTVQWQVSTDGGVRSAPFRSHFGHPKATRQLCRQNGNQYARCYELGRDSPPPPRHPNREQPPTITTQPANQTVMRADGDLHAAATGSPTPRCSGR